MKEIWKPIPSYEGLYEISNLGRVKSFYRKRILKPVTERTGYNQVTLVKQHKKKKHYIHRLVAINFISKIEGCEEINHKDGNKSNNVINNLEWCNRQYNINHSIKVLGNHLGKQCKPVQCIETGKIFKSIKEASSFYNQHPSNLYNLLGNKPSCKTYAKYHWKYV